MVVVRVLLVASAALAMALASAPEADAADFVGGTFGVRATSFSNATGLPDAGGAAARAYALDAVAAFSAASLPPVTVGSRLPLEGTLTWGAPPSPACHGAPCGQPTEMRVMALDPDDGLVVVRLVEQGTDRDPTMVYDGPAGVASWEGATRLPASTGHANNGGKDWRMSAYADIVSSPVPVVFDPVVDCERDAECLATVAGRHGTYPVTYALSAPSRASVSATFAQPGPPLNALPAWVDAAGVLHWDTAGLDDRPTRILASAQVIVHPEHGSGTVLVIDLMLRLPAIEVPIVVGRTGCALGEFSFSFLPPGTSPSGHHWEFGDGHSSSDAGPTHRYAEEGSYTVTLSYSTAGVPGTATAKVDVRDEPCPAPDTDPHGPPAAGRAPADGRDEGVAQADQDGDGVADRDDQCPLEPQPAVGAASAGRTGCPPPSLATAGADAAQEAQAPCIAAGCAPLEAPLAVASAPLREGPSAAPQAVAGSTSGAALQLAALALPALAAPLVALRRRRA